MHDVNDARAKSINDNIVYSKELIKCSPYFNKKFGKNLVSNYKDEDAITL